MSFATFVLLTVVVFVFLLAIAASWTLLAGADADDFMEEESDATGVCRCGANDDLCDDCWREIGA